MGKIIVRENISLDGVTTDSTGDESRDSWLQLADGDREAWAEVLLDEALDARALLLGRRTDKWFAGRWPDRTGEWADRLNGMPKYVVSSTLEAPKWSNATVINVDQVEKLKQKVDGDIVVYGSGQLVRTLIERDLVDELRLLVYPVVVGAGEGIFGGTSSVKRMRLISTQTLGEGIAFLTYQPVRAA